MKKYYCRYPKIKIIKDSITYAIDAHDNIFNTDDPTLWSMLEKSPYFNEIPNITKVKKDCH